MRFSAVLISSFLVANPCYADDLCEAVAHVASQAPNGFGSLLSEPMSDGAAAVNYSLPGSARPVFEDGHVGIGCNVSYAMNLDTGELSRHRYYTCTFALTNGAHTYDHDQANIDKDAMAQRLAGCLGISMSDYVYDASGRHNYGVNRNGIWYQVWSDGFTPAIELRIETFQPPYGRLPL